MNKVPSKVSFSIHKARIEKRRKLIILTGVEKRQSSNFNFAIKWKNIGKCWYSNPYLALQNPVVLPTVPWEPSEFLTNVTEFIKMYGPTYSNQDLLIDKFLFSPHYRDNPFKNRINLQKDTEKNDPTG